MLSKKYKSIPTEKQKAIQRLKKFLIQKRPPSDVLLSAASLFSGGGIGDIGYELAGFTLRFQVELDSHRVELCKENFPVSEVLEKNIPVVIPMYLNMWHTALIVWQK